MSFAWPTATTRPAWCGSRCTDVPIPTKFDGDVTAIDDMAANILLQVRIMQNAAASDIPRMRTRLREMLQQHAEKVIKVARQE